MSATNTMQLALLDLVFGATSWTIPGTLYVGLFTATPGVGGGGTEVSGGSYARVAKTNNTTNFPNASVVSTVGTKKNGTDIQFPTSTADWGAVTHGGIFDAESGGVLLWFGPLDVSRTFVSGDAPKILANSMTITAT